MSKAHAEMSQEEFEQALALVMSRSTKEPERMNAGLGLALIDCTIAGDGEAVFGYTAKSEHLNPLGAVHGGIVSALLDTCMGTSIAARTGHRVITTDLSVSFLRALTDSHFRIHITFTHVGRRLSSMTGRVINADTDELCATGMGTFMLLDTGGSAEVQV